MFLRYLAITLLKVNINTWENILMAPLPAEDRQKGQQLRRSLRVKLDMEGTLSLEEVMRSQEWSY